MLIVARFSNLRLLAAALISLFCAIPMTADVTGSISGLVRDSSQAAIPNAQISAVNTATNFTKNTVSDTNGQYNLLALPVGTYKIVATAPGFDQFIASGVDLKVNDELRIEVTLTIGTVQQKVNVEANTVQVETQSTQLGSVIESQKMLAMPLNGRSFLDLLPLQAGVVPITSGVLPNDRPVSGLYSNPGNVSVSGQRESGNAFLVNGGDVSEGKNMGAGLVPNLDSIAEFRLITNSFDAEYGRFSGAVMNAITKSGTNSFHGDVFEFVRNDAFDARNFFDPTKAELRRNQFGYALGGPLWKNRLFWFTDYQGTRQVSGASTGIVQLPTADERNGILSPSSFLNSSGTPSDVNGSYWAQLLSQRLGYTVQNGEPYSYSGCSSSTQCVFPNGIIPQRAFDPVAINVMKYIPQANLDPSAGLYSDASQKAPVVDDKIGQRVDLNNEKTGNWSFYYHFDDSTVTNPLNASVPGFSSVTPSRAQMATMSNTKTFGATTVNEARLSFFRTSIFTNKPTSSFVSLSSLGFTTGAGTLGIVDSGPVGYQERVPNINFNDFDLGVNWLSMYQANNTYMLADNLSKVSGSHTFKFGGEYRYLQLNARNTCAPNGDFTFTGSETGTDFADFLLGAPSSYVQCSQQFLDSRSRYGGLFAQDSWKLKPNLTLNVGLRWEVSTPWYDARNEISTIVPGEQSTVYPTAPQGLVFPGDPGVPRTISRTRWNNLAPRIGIAYSPNKPDGLWGKIFGGPGKSSFRAAYGIYYMSQEDLGNFGLIGDAPFGLYWTSLQPPLFDTPYQDRSDGVSQGQRFPFTPPVAGSAANGTLNFAPYLPIETPGYPVDNKLPYAEHYNFSFQRQLGRATVLTLSYVGTQSHHLIAQLEANAGSAAVCQQLNAEGATPTCGPYGEMTTYTLPNGSQVHGTTTAFPATQWSVYAQYFAAIANSNYNAGEVTLEHKAGNMTFLGAYTYSKAMDNASGLNDYVIYTNYALSHGLSAFDMRHNFVLSYNWALPFDRAFSGLPKRLTQGWNITGISRFSTGIPVTLSQQSGDLSLIGQDAMDLPNVVSPVVIQNARNSGPTGPNTYFLPTSFTSENLGQIGDANRRFFSGPGLLNTDFGLMKTTRVTESTSFVIRAEFFNIFNHAQFNNPIGNYSSSQFGEVTSARDPRIGQVSAKFIW